MPESEYERRVFVKDGREQICASQQQEVSLRWSGWRPADEPPPAPTPKFADGGLLPPGATEAGTASGEDEPVATTRRPRTKATD